MTEQSNWMTVPEAARLIGLSERAARDWLRRYAVPTNGGRPLLVDAAALRRTLADVAGQPRTTPHKPPEAPEAPRMPQEPIEATFRDAEAGEPSGVAPVPFSTSLVPLSAYDELRAHSEELAREVGQIEGRLLERLAARDAEIARLRAELDAARKPPEVATEAPEAAPEVPRKWWQRFLP